jgi:hypothetical protein
VGAGLFLIPPEPEANISAQGPCGEVASTNDLASTEDSEKTNSVDLDADGNPIVNEYAKLNNQFVIPIVEEGLVSALVVMALSVEVPTGQKEAVFSAEPKLRDAFLQAMFDHANVGGFSGNFTSAQNLRPLRDDLRQRAKAILPGIAKDVLIIDIVRQDG